MARGRKKGGLRIDKLKDKTEIIDIIVNQIKSINNKRRAFNKKNIHEYEDFIYSLIDKNTGQILESGNISTSKKFYENKTILWLKKALSIFHKINNHEHIGTVNKFEKAFDDRLRGLMNKIHQVLSDKNYSEDYIQELITDRNFLNVLIEEFKNSYEDYASHQVIEKVALNYRSDKISKHERQRQIFTCPLSLNGWQDPSI